MAKKHAKSKSGVHERIVAALGTRGSFRIAGLLVAFAVVIGLAVYGACEARRRVENDSRFRFDGWALEVGDLPWWVTPEIQRDLAGSYRLDREAFSLFGEDAMDRLRRALERSPWVRSATDLELVYPTSERVGRIRATLVLRPPIAMVEIGSECFLADVEGRRLGEPYDASAQAWFRVPRIIGVRGGFAMPAAGDPWRSNDIVQGIGVARVLAENGIAIDFPDHPIDAIDVSNVDGRADRRASEVDLICGGRVFEWGRSPYATGSQVMPIRRKLENLRRVLSDPRFGTVRVVSLYTTPLVGS